MDGKRYNNQQKAGVPIEILDKVGFRKLSETEKDITQ